MRYILLRVMQLKKLTKIGFQKEEQWLVIAFKILVEYFYFIYFLIQY